MKLSARISNLRRVLVNKVGLSTEDQQEFEAIYARALGVEKGTLPYEIKVDSTDLDVSLEKFVSKLDEIYGNGSVLSQILENAQANREVADLYLMLMDAEYIKYATIDKFNENFKTSKLKANSLVSQLTKIYNGMINEIKRLEKENEALKNIGK